MIDCKIGKLLWSVMFLWLLHHSKNMKQTIQKNLGYPRLSFPLLKAYVMPAAFQPLWIVFTMNCAYLVIQFHHQIHINRFNRDSFNGTLMSCNCLPSWNCLQIFKEYQLLNFPCKNVFACPLCQIQWLKYKNIMCRNTHNFNVFIKI